MLVLCEKSLDAIASLDFSTFYGTQIDGLFIGRKFINSYWIDGLFRGRKYINSYWIDGLFRGRKHINSIWIDGLFKESDTLG